MIAQAALTRVCWRHMYVLFAACPLLRPTCMALLAAPLLTHKLLVLWSLGGGGSSECCLPAGSLALTPLRCLRLAAAGRSSAGWRRLAQESRTADTRAGSPGRLPPAGLCDA